MSAEVLDDLFNRRQMINRTLFLMELAGVCVMHTPYGPVRASELRTDAEQLDRILIAKLDELPISAVLLKLI